MTVHVAVDIGASSGRIILGYVQNSTLKTEEIYRFKNEFVKDGTTLYWDTNYLLYEILTGLEKIKDKNYKKCTLGIDTWAVDYALIGKDGKKLREIISYRDKRTYNSINKLATKISKQDLYNKTGIQFLPFNTIYQLYEDARNILSKTKKILLVPDYLNYCLTGKAAMEETNASTTQLLNIGTKTLDEELLKIIRLKLSHFAKLVKPGNLLGYLNKELFPNFQLPEVNIINVASHDTASAVAGIPATDNNWAFLNSGTWSLLGIESNKPYINDLSFEKNYTNEWGVDNTFRVLKNITGLWIMQEVQRNLGESYTFEQFILLAKSVKPYQQFIDFNRDRFINPKNMIIEIQNYCEETNQKIPDSPAELISCVYYNLAILYAISIEELENITNKSINRIYIVGGGAQNNFLNQLTADLSNKSVIVGPKEATAVGNLLIQMISYKKIDNLKEGRRLIKNSFTNEIFYPKAIDRKSILSKFKLSV